MVCHIFIPTVSCLSGWFFSRISLKAFSCHMGWHNFMPAVLSFFCSSQMSWIFSEECVVVPGNFQRCMIPYRHFFSVRKYTPPYSLPPPTHSHYQNVLSYNHFCLVFFLSYIWSIFICLCDMFCVWFPFNPLGKYVWSILLPMKRKIVFKWWSKEKIKNIFHNYTYFEYKGPKCLFGMNNQLDFIEMYILYQYMNIPCSYLPDLELSII